MISNSQKWRFAIVSTLTLSLLLAILFILKWCLIQIGVYISGFEGQIVINYFKIDALSDNWNLSQVLWIYLFPYVSIIIIYFVINWRPQHPIKISFFLLFMRSWAYLLIILLVFFMPIYEILSRQGIYFALNWLYINHTFQLLFGVIMLIYLFVRAFRIATLFSAALIIPSDNIAIKNQTTIQLIFILYIPLAIISLIIFVGLKASLFSAASYFLLGMLILIFINTLLIRRYNVII